MTYSEIVSFDDELLILVDENDTILGYESKAVCHQGEGILHRAFSIFIFDHFDRLILQQRSEQKFLWPLYWSNSCCSHPRKGESLDIAAQRRLEEELGIKTKLKYLYSFRYQAKYQDLGSENELCAVLIGRSNIAPKINKNEIAEWKYIHPDELSVDIEKNSQRYTPWFKMEWQKISSEYMNDIKDL